MKWEPGSWLSSARGWVSGHKVLSIALVSLLVGAALLTYGVVRFAGGGDRARDIQQELADRWAQGQVDPAAELGKSLAEGAEDGKPDTDTPTPPPVPWGSLVARLTSDRLGLSWYVVEGVNADDIASAPGHYPGTALPGMRGNFAIAGHREHGLFWDLDQIREGDVFTVETKTWRFRYIVTHNPIIVNPNAWNEVSPVPPGFRKGERILTLTTCDPKWDNYHRLIVHAALMSEEKIA